MAIKLPKSKLPDLGNSIFSVMSSLANSHGAINLAQGFPDFDCDARLKTFVSHYINQGYNQYAPMPGIPKLRQVIGNKIHALYNHEVDWEREITITSGATQAIFTAISTFVKKKDEVILIEPAYDCYAPAVKLNGGKIVSYELMSPDYRIDWEKFKTLLSGNTRMIIFNNPHNPTGKIYSQEDLNQLFEIIKDTNIMVLSDEVYEHLVFDDKKHQSILSHDGLYNRSLATFSFGKTFHNTGWKMGYAVGPPKLMSEFRKVHQFNVFSVNTPFQYGLADYLANPKNYLELKSFYQEKRDLFAGHMNKTPFKPIGCEGTYFQLYDYSDICDLNDVDFAREMTTNWGVATIPVSVFYTQKLDQKVVRFCFAKTSETLEAAGHKIQSINTMATSKSK